MRRMMLVALCSSLVIGRSGPVLNITPIRGGAIIHSLHRYGVPGVAGGGAPTRIVDLGTGGTGVGAQVVNGEIEDGEDGPVHIHRNALGDTDNARGASDLDSTVHRWLTPVARVVITVPAS